MDVSAGNLRDKNTRQASSWIGAKSEKMFKNGKSNGSKTNIRSQLPVTVEKIVTRIKGLISETKYFSGRCKKGELNGTGNQ